jgi:hypothetical protein
LALLSPERVLTSVRSIPIFSYDSIVFINFSSFCRPALLTLFTVNVSCQKTKLPLGKQKNKGRAFGKKQKRLVPIGVDSRRFPVDRHIGWALSVAFALWMLFDWYKTDTTYFETTLISSRKKTSYLRKQ